MRVVDDNHSDVFMLRIENDDIYNIEQDIVKKLQVNGGSPGKADQYKSKSTSSSPQRSKCGRPANPTPRHKRESHIKAEYKRRDKIQKGFETLKDLVPSLGESSQKESKSAKLLKTVEYCRQLKADNKSRQDEASALRAELEALGSQIHSLQKRLPAAGITVVDKPCQMDRMYEEYVKSRTKQNWKFWIFSFIMKPLYDSYKRIVSVTTPAELYRTVVEWMKDQLSLTSLRPGVFSSLRQISTQTKIMDKPGDLPQQALEMVEGNTTNHFSHDQMETVDLRSSTNINVAASPETTSAMPSFDLESLLSVNERNTNNQASILPPAISNTTEDSLFDGLDNFITDSLMNSLQGSEDIEEPMCTTSFSSFNGTIITTAQSIINVNPSPVTAISVDPVFTNALPVTAISVNPVFTNTLPVTAISVDPAFTNTLSQTVLSDMTMPVSAISVDSIFSTTLPQTVHSDLPIESIFCTKTSPVTMPSSMTTDCVSSGDYQTLTINSSSIQTDTYAATLQNLFKTL